MIRLETQRIVFFDGYCGLCNRSVDFLLRMDVHRQLLFSPLQGEAAARLLDPKMLSDLDTIIFWDEGMVRFRSDAVLRAAAKTSFFAAILAAPAFLIPRFIRDAIYNFIAKRRNQLFGKRSACRLPTKEERTRFLP